MNSKTLRNIHPSKPKSSSVSFVSMKFNKDDDQLEINYGDEKKSDYDINVDASDLDVSESLKDIFLKKGSETSYLKSVEDCDHIRGNISDQFNFPEYVSKVNSIKVSSSQFEFSTDNTKLQKDSYVPKDEKKESSPLKNEVGSNESDDKQSRQNKTLTFPTIDKTLTDKNFQTFNITNSSKHKKDELIQRESFEVKECSDLANSSSDDLSVDKSNKIEYYNCSTVELSKETGQPQDQNSFSHFIKSIADFFKYIRNSTMCHIIIVVIALIFAPIPSWLSGFLIGVFNSSCLFYWMFKPRKIPSSATIPVLHRKRESSELKENSVILKGWMNLLPPPLEYNEDTYHVTSTRSVYVRLDGSYLRFSFPQNNISKRALFDEPQPEMKFVYQQHFDINGALIELLPKRLAKKRLWSKKYPICIKIPNSKEAILSNSMTGSTSIDSISTKSINRKDFFGKKLPTRINTDNEVVIYLFSRTDREKDLWFKRFQRVANAKDLLTRFSRDDIPSDLMPDRRRTVSVNFASDFRLESFVEESNKKTSFDDEIDSFVRLELTKEELFENYMMNLLSPVRLDRLGSSSVSKNEKKEGSEKNLNWLNILMGRIFFDVLSEEKWARLVTRKIQRKLNKLKLPQFLSELTVKDINLGSSLPKIHEASNPSEDEQGLWIDVSLSYNGSFRMTLETKLDLMRLNHEDLASPSDVPLPDITEIKQELQADAVKAEELVKPIDGSSSEDSAESSSDDETPHISKDGASPDNASASGSRKKRILRLVDRLAHSAYFQQAVRSKYVKRAMRDISNTPLLLTVEVQWLTGILAINIPPAPTDRLWYGFRSNPSLSLCARPKLGQHIVRSTHVTEWIEKKLISEFQKILVMPNMDDLIIPVMESNLEHSNS